MEHGRPAYVSNVYTLPPLVSQATTGLANSHFRMMTHGMVL
jgi:hypothetical protein